MIWSWIIAERPISLSTAFAWGAEGWMAGAQEDGNGQMEINWEWKDIYSTVETY
jgi:hypothetical protein